MCKTCDQIYIIAKKNDCHVYIYKILIHHHDINEDLIKHAHKRLNSEPKTSDVFQGSMYQDKSAEQRRH